MTEKKLETSNFSQFKRISMLTFTELRNNPSLLVGNILIIFVGGPMIIFEMFIMLWLKSYYDKENGPITDVDEVYHLY